MNSAFFYPAAASRTAFGADFWTEPNFYFPSDEAEYQYACNCEDDNDYWCRWEDLLILDCHAEFRIKIDDSSVFCIYNISTSRIFLGNRSICRGGVWCRKVCIARSFFWRTTSAFAILRRIHANIFIHVLELNGPCFSLRGCRVAWLTCIVRIAGGERHRLFTFFAHAPSQSLSARCLTITIITG